MQIIIPFKTPTINHLYGQRGFRKFLTKEAKDLRLEILGIIANLGLNVDYLASNKLKIVTEIHENWYTLDGEILRKDVGNREKFLIDSIFEALGLDDKIIWEHTIKKVQNDDEEKAVITFEVI